MVKSAFRYMNAADCKNLVFDRKERAATRDFATAAGMPCFDLFGVFKHANVF